MREAARVAGILDDRDGGTTELDFVPEPQAAALAVIEDYTDHRIQV
jgi:hypothetical protein